MPIKTTHVQDRLSVTTTLTEMVQAFEQHLKEKYPDVVIDFIHVVSHSTSVMTIECGDNGLVETFACRHRAKGN